ncbi:MAG: hypothetical protein LQ337_005343 [Flavoplaca oasis]|nr:MAG: hypothetical protein LQ337_005343 [Flavoplaca oasis]
MPATFVKRSVTPLRFESLRPDPNDILCPGSDVEETLQGHEAKRRRVERAGEEYLRGKPLYIASARLKGPFTCGWSNLYHTTRSRFIRQRPAAENLKQYAAPGCQDIPIEISSHETEVSIIPKPAAHSYRRTSSENVAKPANPKFLKRPHPKESKHTTRRYPSPATSTSPDKTEQSKKIKTSVPTRRDWFRSANRNEESLERSSRSPTPGPARGSQRTNVAGILRRKSSRSVAPPDGGIERESSANQAPPAAEGKALPAPSSLAVALFLPERQAEAVDAKLRHVSPDVPRAHETVKSSQHTPEHVPDDRGLFEAKKLSQAAILRAQRNSPTVFEPPARHNRPNVVSEALCRREIIPERTVHALQSSTTLPEFEYGRGSRERSRSPERKSFKEDLEALKKKARADKRWRLSFTASGNVKTRNTKVDTPRVSQPRQRSSDVKVSQFANHSSTELKKHIEKSVQQEDKEARSRPIESLPEAQVVQEPALKMPSGLSTGILETDKLSTKLPSAEEGDSYLGLSTQAAMLKAQNNFQNDLTSPTESRANPLLPPTHDNRTHDAVEDEPQREIVEHAVPKTMFHTPQKEKEPMNTQAMIDAISPFAVTTIKKPALEVRPALTPSGSHSSSSLSPAAPNFEKNSLSMSTSPFPTPAPANDQPPMPLSGLSKPASSVTSFSIAPNGTMTEVFQQDGQPPQDYLMGDMDLDAAIEEAGSFLGEWNLEKEARNQG